MKKQINSMEDLNDLPIIAKDNRTNIPIYRAKKIDSDEYVDGYSVDKYILFNDSNLIGLDRSDLPFYEIDPSTLAIHFPDMIDSEGTKIFASLSEDGRGGDTLEDSASTLKANYVVLFNDLKICLRDIDGNHAHYHDKKGNAPYKYMNKKCTKVTGIQQ